MWTSRKTSTRSAATSTGGDHLEARAEGAYEGPRELGDVLDGESPKKCSGPEASLRIRAARGETSVRRSVREAGGRAASQVSGGVRVGEDEEARHDGGEGRRRRRTC